MTMKISELSRITGVKAGTIRFYEKCGFLEPAERLPNRYRVFCTRHIYQVRICRMVFGGFVNKRLRKLSQGILRAARDWNLENYRDATNSYLEAVEEDIESTKEAITTVTEQLQKKDGCQKFESTENETLYSKKQAAELVGVTPEAIRNWERNGLLGQTEAYQRRFYSKWALERMYVIRLLLDNGYSMMAVQSFFVELDAGKRQEAKHVLLYPKENENLIYRADRYLETLLRERENARQLCELGEEMSSLQETK